MSLDGARLLVRARHRRTAHAAAHDAFAAVTVVARRHRDARVDRGAARHRRSDDGDPRPGPRLGHLARASCSLTTRPVGGGASPRHGRRRGGRRVGRRARSCRPPVTCSPRGPGRRRTHGCSLACSASPAGSPTCSVVPVTSSGSPTPDGRVQLLRIRAVVRLELRTLRTTSTRSSCRRARRLGRLTPPTAGRRVRPAPDPAAGSAATRGNVMELVKGQVAVVTGGGQRHRAGAGRPVRRAPGCTSCWPTSRRTRWRRRAAEVGGARRRGADRARPTSARRPTSRPSPSGTLERFGAVHVVCNNAGVAARADPWFGPLSSWEWVMGVNFWGVVHGCRAFLPHLVGGGHIVNTASIAGLYPGLRPELRRVEARRRGDDRELLQHRAGRRPADRRQRAVPRLGAHADPRRRPQLARPRWAPSPTTTRPRRSSAATTSSRPSPRAAPPASVADAVADAVTAGRFWVIPHQDFLDLCIERWATIAERARSRAGRAGARACRRARRSSPRSRPRSASRAGAGTPD